MIHWTLPRRIALGFGVVVAITVGLGGLSLELLQRIRHQSSNFSEQEYPMTVSLCGIESLIKENYINCAQHIEASQAADMEKLAAGMKKTTEQISELYAAVDKLDLSPEEVEQYQKIKAARTAYRDVREKMLALSKEGKKDEARKLLNSDLYAAYQNYVKMIVEQTAIAKRDGQAAAAMTQTIISQARLVLMIGSGFAVVAALALGWLITKRTTKIIKDASASLDDSSAQVSSASSMVSNSAQHLAQGSSEQAASLEETSASLEEISGMTQRNAASAQNAKSISNGTRVVAEQGASDMEQMAKAMDAIKDSSANIAKIIKTIDEIAFQTNILALNAAVEAARAGEAGAGFAVVAEEVRALAQRSAQAAKETASNIEDSIMKSGHGVEISAKVASSLQEIVVKVRESDMLVGEIATASSEQAQGIVQVLEAVTKIDRVTQGNAASAEEAAAAAEELNAQAFALKNLVDELNKLVGTKSVAASGHEKVPMTKGPKPDSGAFKITPSKKTESKVEKRLEAQKAVVKQAATASVAAETASAEESKSSHAAAAPNPMDFQDFSASTPAPAPAATKKVTTAKAAAQNAKNYDDFFSS